MKRTSADSPMQVSSTMIADNTLLRLLEKAGLEELINEHNTGRRDRIYPMKQTLVMFLKQVLGNQSSLQSMVAANNTRLAKTSENPSLPSGDTSGYSRARKRLPSVLPETLFKRLGRYCSSLALMGWKWCGRRVLAVDGTTVSMPDTKSNQETYPQPSSQAPGLGFPQARMSLLTCTSTGAILDAAVGPSEGKRSGELAQFRERVGNVEAGDVLLGDALYENYWCLAAVIAKGADVIFEINGSRNKPERWETSRVFKRPPRPDWMDHAEYQAIPASIKIRLVRCQKRGYEPRFLVTTLLDKKAFKSNAIRSIYQSRWLIETDIRSLKIELGGDILRCRTAMMVLKELYVHLLGFNLVRQVSAEAARHRKKRPRQISFVSVRDHLMTLIDDTFALTRAQWRAILKSISASRVGMRPGRYEPRAVKRRPKPRPLMDLNRKDARKHRVAYER